MKYKIKEASMNELISKIPALMRSRFLITKYDKEADYHYISLRVIVEKVGDE
jgi:hypothetical protein